MSEETKRIIKKIVEDLKHLSVESLRLIQGSAEILKVRDATDKQEPEKKEG